MIACFLGGTCGQNLAGGDTKTFYRTRPCPPSNLPINVLQIRKIPDTLNHGQNFKFGTHISRYM